jgi:hypothetical protein
MDNIANTIKQKYPQYAHLDDVDLVSRISKKYPNYQTMFGGGGGSSSPALPSRLNGPTANLAVKMYESDQERQNKRTLEGSRESASAAKGHTAATADLLKNYPAIAKMGFQVGDMVPDRFIGDQSKPASKGGQQDLTQEEQNALVQASLRQKDPLALSMITFRGPRAKTMAQALLKDPAWSPNAAEAGLAGARGEGSATGKVKGGKGFETAATTGSLDDILSKAEPLLKSLAPSNVKVLNRAYQEGLREIKNDPKATEFLTLMAGAEGLYSQTLMAQGTPTDQARRMAHEAVGRGLNSGSFAAMKDAVLFEGKSRASRLQGKTPPSDNLDALIDKHLGGQ